MRFYALLMKLLFAHVPFSILAEMSSNVPFIPVLSFSSPFFTVNMYMFSLSFFVAFCKCVKSSFKLLSYFLLSSIMSSEISSSAPMSSSFYNREECCEVTCEHPLLKTPCFLSMLSRPVVSSCIL